MDRKDGSVKGKIACAFEVSFQETPDGGKRRGQGYAVTATETLSEAFRDLSCRTSFEWTEKLDGTCALVQIFEGKPWLWARWDRRPTKEAVKRANKLKYKFESRRPAFEVETDYSEVPNWQPADNCHSGPDVHGHWFGWVPLEPGSKHHIWHSAAVDLEFGIALVLVEGDAGQLVVELRRLACLVGRTLELIGTSINGNPYGLGSKSHPFHILVPHGEVKVRLPPAMVHSELYQFLETSHRGRIEGVVLHNEYGDMFKVISFFSPDTTI